MRNFFIVAWGLALNITALAGTVNLTSDESNSNPAIARLADVPQGILGILTDNGIRPKNVGDGIFTVAAKNIHCDWRHRGNEVETPTAGIATNVCRLNSKDIQGSTHGQILRDGRALQEFLAKIENANVGGQYQDCAMGYCGTWVTSISCSIDTKIEEFHTGRFVCTLVDEY